MSKKRIRLQVPSWHEPALLALARLTPEQAEEVIRRFGDLPEPATREAVVALLAATVDERHAQDLAEALVSLELLRTSHSWTFADVAKAVADAPELAEASGTAFGATLEALLSANPLSRAAKALDLATAYERELHISRVLTDIRPVFDDKVAGAPVGVVIVHQLELRAFVRGRLESMYVGMLADDVIELRAQLDRAVEKDEALRDMMARAGVAIHVPEKDEV